MAASYGEMLKRWCALGTSRRDGGVQGTRAEHPWRTGVPSTQAQRHVVIVSPPYAPCVANWRQNGVDMRRVEFVDAGEKDVLRTTEQCLRSGSCTAALVRCG